MDLVDGIQVEKVTTASQSKSVNVWILKQRTLSALAALGAHSPSDEHEEQGCLRRAHKVD
jgi:hypothetical protein